MKKVTIRTLSRMRDEGRKVVMVTAYDSTMARIMEDAGVDAILVGDSLGMVVQGYDSTLPVTLDQVIYHTSAVRRGASKPHLVADMPFMSYQASIDDAVRNAGRLIAEGGAEAVKLEGGSEYADVVGRIVRAGIPVMGHIGLTPQSVHKLGGYAVQGRSKQAVKALIEDALALQEAGCYSLVLECVPAEVAEKITDLLSIPTIGIGAGAGCSGQVLVCYDFLGFNPEFTPKFLKKYADGYSLIRAATEEYIEEVRDGVFPAASNSFRADPELRLDDIHGRPTIRILEGDATAASEDGGVTRLYGGKKAI